MNKEERIQLRNELYKEFKIKNIIIINNITRLIKKRLLNELNNNVQLNEKYNEYVQQFRTEKEAQYCLIHHDDFDNHLCPICNNVCNFYEKKSKYYKICENKKCRFTQIMEKSKNTKKERYGNEYYNNKEKIEETKLKLYGNPYYNNMEKCKNTKLERYGDPYYNNMEKAKETCLIRYNVKYTCQINGMQEKSKKTCLIKYGKEYASQSKEFQERVTNTCLKKYNAKRPLQNKEIQKKAKQTCLVRYGNENPFASKIIQEKSKQTCLIKYGKEYASQSKEFKEKVRNTCLKKYNVDNVFKSEKIKNKSRNTMKNKYNVEYASQSEEFKEKSKQTCLIRYGKEYASQSEEFKEKVRNTIIKKNSFNNPIKNDEICNIIDKYFDSITINDIYSNNKHFENFIKILYKEKNRLLRLNEISNIFNLNPQTIRKRLTLLNLLQYFYIKDSNLELQFKKFLVNNKINVNRHYRKLETTKNLGRPEIDFILINENIGFEINDLGTHNIKNKDINYHINKTIIANNKHIRLIHLWEWELTDEKIWNKVSKWILNLCNNNKIKIGARKCLIKEISLQEEKEFLENYHLQGYVKSTICYGLYYGNELIQVMSFGIPRYNKNYQWELLRLCTKYRYTVIGGAQKLLKYFIKNNNPLSIISYCDLSKFTGKVYEELGFKLLRRNQPSATWYNEKTGKIFKDTSLLKLGADKLIGTNYGKGTDNEEIAYKSGYQKVYDCGTNVYTLTFNN